ncbi:thymosin beta isoform X2 [Rhagoletis pomonella]|uniref:thymosin beta isoform X2 n=1 Tax=Rhagoletis pomonella TaxID=28610 RepID=UPI00177EB993|nr:thymosin beta isoform X2 [Rhagoletis pomonella]
MASPALKDLPKVAENLKSQLEGFNTEQLKNASTHEKIVLPTAEDVAAEKTQQSLISGIAAFNPSNLKHTETNEKNPLPDKEVVSEIKLRREDSTLNIKYYEGSQESSGCKCMLKTLLN